MLWGVKWRSRQEGVFYDENLMYNSGIPLMFKKRKDARKYIQDQWGYIKKRPDLRGHPHYWLMPIPVKVKIVEIQ